MKVAVLDDYQQVAFSYADWSLLPSWVTVEFFSNHISDDDLVNNMKDFDAIVGMRERTPFPKTVIEKLPKLKLLITTGWRNASFDLEAATVNGITVCGTETGGEGTTELTWGLIIGLIRHIGIEQESSKKGFWGTTVGGDLKGQTLGILGLGHIGSLVAKVGIAFGMEVIAWSQNLTHDIAVQCGAKLVEKKVLFEMLSNPGKIYSREEIKRISDISQERSIDVMITRLRQKIETSPKNPKYLQTIRGSGYVLWVE